MKNINEMLDKIIDDGINREYLINVNFNFEKELFNRINLEEKFINEDIKSYRLAKIISFLLLGLIFSSLIVISSVSALNENYKFNSILIRFYNIISDVFLYVFSIFGVRTDSGYIISLLIGFLLVVGFLYFEKFNLKKKSF